MTDAELRAWAVAAAPAVPQAAAVLRLLDFVSELQGIVESLAARVAKQSELLSRKAEVEPVPPVAPDLAADPEATWDLAEPAGAGGGGEGEWEAYLQGEYRSG